MEGTTNGNTENENNIKNDSNYGVYYPTNSYIDGDRSQDPQSQFYRPQPEADYPVEVIDLDRMNALAGKNAAADVSSTSTLLGSSYHSYVLPSSTAPPTTASPVFVTRPYHPEPWVPHNYSTEDSQMSHQSDHESGTTPSGIKIIRASPNQINSRGARRPNIRSRGRGRMSGTLPTRTPDNSVNEAVVETNISILQEAFPTLSQKTISRVYLNCVHNMNRAMKELKRIEEFEQKKKDIRIISEEEQALQRPLVSDSVDINSLFKRVICKTDVNPNNGRNVIKAVIQEDVADTEAKITQFMSNSCVQILPSGNSPSVAVRGPGRPRGPYRGSTRSSPRVNQHLYTRRSTPISKPAEIKNVVEMEIGYNSNDEKQSNHSCDEGSASANCKDMPMAETSTISITNALSDNVDHNYSVPLTSANEVSTTTIATTKIEPSGGAGEKKFFRHKRRFEANSSVVKSENETNTSSKLTKVSPADLSFSATTTSFNRDDSKDEVSDQTLLYYVNDSTIEELCLIPHCSLRKAKVIERLRPFTSYDDFFSRVGSAVSKGNEKISSSKSDGAGNFPLLVWQGCRELFGMRTSVNKLLKRCEAQVAKNNALNTLRQLVDQIEMTPQLLNILESTQHSDVECDGLIEEVIKEQPTCLNKNLFLKPFQMVGLNWLRQLHSRNLNGILADEMGLGKTIQSIAFLAYLLERRGDRGPHLIIVPTSTLHNWARELALWCPTLNVVTYVGTQEERKDLRLRIYGGRLSDFNVLLTTYHIATSSIEDRSLMKRINFHYGVFDEAHMLKNMMSQRYRSFMNFTVQRRLLLTGTPLQNNFQELFSLLAFLMPDQFGQYVDSLKKLFNLYARASQEIGKSKNREPFSAFEIEKIEHAKTLLRPFFLRRLKSQVLNQLPPKVVEVIQLDMLPNQKTIYDNLIIKIKETASASSSSSSSNGATSSTSSNKTLTELMQLRKAANHPLLLLQYYTDDKIRAIAQTLIREDPQHAHSDTDLVVEDLLALNSDYLIHSICKQHEEILSSYMLPRDLFLHSAKLSYLDTLLPILHKAGDRVLLFSQFLHMLDILEEYLRVRNYSFLRMDGQTPAAERQELIDKFNATTVVNNQIEKEEEDDDKEEEEDENEGEEEKIDKEENHKTTKSPPFVFLLSTRAGGLGINLTAANVVIMHDIDFNPHNDRQAEDRAHRVGQTKDVRVYRLVTKDSIEEDMYAVAEEKMKLGGVITGDKDADNSDVDEVMGIESNSSTAACGGGGSGHTVSKEVRPGGLQDECILMSNDLVDNASTEAPDTWFSSHHFLNKILNPQ